MFLCKQINRKMLSEKNHCFYRNALLKSLYLVSLGGWNSSPDDTDSWLVVESEVRVPLAPKCCVSVRGRVERRSVCSAGAGAACARACRARWTMRGSLGSPESPVKVELIAWWCSMAAAVRHGKEHFIRSWTMYRCVAIYRSVWVRP